MATTRKQMFLEKIHDSSFATPVPVTVEEEILDGMSGGGGGFLIYDLYYDDDNGTYGVHELTYRGVKEAIENHKILLLFGKDHSWYGGGTEGRMDMYMAVGFEAIEEVVEGEVVTAYTARFVGYNGDYSFVSKPLLEETIDSELYAVSD